MQEEYRQPKERAKEIASEAFARIEQENLPATPDIFELWYAYYSGEFAEITRAVDIIVAQKFNLTTERCRELHRRLLNSDRSKETLQKAEEIVSSTLSDVDEMVSSVRTSNQDFTGSFENTTARLEQAQNPEELKKIAQQMILETQKMIQENQSLEEKLQKSSSTMQELKIEMETVRKEAFTDGLTGIANRKKFDLEIVRLISEGRDNETPTSIVVIDIDHFKGFNDTYGHQVGDQVLRLVARTLHDGLKGRDFPARYGGEEFVIILPETSSENAGKVADTLREAVMGKEIVNRATGEKLSRVTISAGVAELGDEETPKEWIERADKALYRAKRKGRNRVEQADPIRIK